MQAPFGLTSSGSHVQATSTGTADVHTLNPPTGAHGCFITVQTNNIYMVLDGSTPSSSNGLHFVKDAAPQFLPIARPISFASDAAANAVVSVIWVS